MKLLWTVATVVLCCSWHCSVFTCAQETPSDTKAEGARVIWSIDQIPKDCEIADLALTKDSRLLAVAYSDIVQIWDIRTRKKTREMRLAKRNHMTFSEDGRMLAMIQNGKELVVWEIASGRIRSHVRFDKEGENISDLEWNCSGDRLAMVFGNGKRTKIFDMNRKIIRILPEQAKQIWCTKFMNNDEILACCLRPDSLVRIDVETGKQITEVALTCRFELSADWTMAAISRNRAQNDRNWIEIHDAERGKEVWSFQENEFVGRTIFSPDNRWLAAAKRIKGQNVLSVWDLNAKKRLFDLVTDGVDADHWIAFSTDRKYLFTMPATRRKIDVWQLPSSK